MFTYWSTVKPPYNGTAMDRIFFRSSKVQIKNNYFKFNYVHSVHYNDL